MNIKPIEKKTVTEQIIDQIIDQISTGRLKLNDKLPSERDMAEMLDVGRASVREAMIILSVHGWIERTSGGSFVKNTDMNKKIMINRGVNFTEDDYEDLYELRKIIETKSAALAARYADDSDVEILLELYKELNYFAKDKDLEEFAKSDAEFHQMIAYISQNKILYNVVSEILDLLKSQILLNTESHLKNSGEDIYDKTLLDHRKILEAIEEQDEKTAEKMMFNHLEDQIVIRKKNKR